MILRHWSLSLLLLTLGAIASVCAIICKGKAERGGDPERHNRHMSDLRCASTTKFCLAQEGILQRVLPKVINYHESHTIFDCYDRFHFDLLERYLKLGKQHQPVKSGCTEFEILNPSALVNVTVCLCDWDGCNGAGVAELSRLYPPRYQKIGAPLNPDLNWGNMTHELIPGKIANIGGTGSLKPGQRRLCAAKGLSATPRVECDDNVSTISCPPPLDMCLVFQGRFAASADRAGALTQFLNFTERSCAFPTWPVVFYEFYGIRLRKLPVNKCIPLKGERRHKIDATLCTCSDSDMCNALDVDTYLDNTVTTQEQHCDNYVNWLKQHPDAHMRKLADSHNASAKEWFERVDGIRKGEITMFPKTTTSNIPLADFQDGKTNSPLQSPRGGTPQTPDGAHLVLASAPVLLLCLLLHI